MDENLINILATMLIVGAGAAKAAREKAQDHEECDGYCAGCPEVMPLPLTKVPDIGEKVWYPSHGIGRAAGLSNYITHTEHTASWITNMLERGMLFATQADAENAAEGILTLTKHGLEVAKKIEAIRSENATQPRYTIGDKPMPMPLKELPDEGFVYIVDILHREVRAFPVSSSLATIALKSGLVFHIEDDAEMALAALLDLTNGMRN